MNTVTPKIRIAKAKTAARNTTASPRRAALILAGSVAALLAAPSAQATIYYWDVDGTTAGFSTVVGAWNGTNVFWNTSATGTGGVPVATTSGADDLNIVGALTSTGTITLSGARAASSISIASGVGALTMSGGTSLTIGGTGALSGIFKSSSSAVTISTPLILGAASVFQNNNAGNLALGALNLNGFALTVSGAGITTFDGNAANIISGAGGIIKNGTGTLILDGGTSITHSFTGGITVNGGYVFFQNATNVSGRGNVTLNDGYLEGRFGSSPTFAGGLGTGTTAIRILGGTSGFSGQGATNSAFTIGTALSVLKWGASGENGATGFFNPTVFVATGSTNTNAKGSLNNAIDLNGTTRTITSFQTNGDGATTTGFTISGAISNSTGTAGLIKTGAGALILGAANTYNGSTSIQGGSLILSAAAATINSTTSLALGGGGTLRLVNTAQVNRFADGAAITVTSGGGIDYINTSGAVVYTETLGTVTVSGGNFNVNLATAQAGAGSQTLTFGGLTQSGTGAVTFSALGTGPQATGLKNMIVVTGAGTTAADLIIGPWATTGTTAALQTDYAKYTGNFVVPAAIAASAQTAWSTDFTTGTGTLNNTLVNAAGSAVEGRLTATRNINSVKANSATNAIASGDFTNDTFTVTGSTFANGDVITFGGTAPANLVTGQAYYVVGASGATFSVAATSGGTKIDLTGLGTSNITAGITLSSGNNLGTLGILNAQASGLVIGGSGTGVVTLPTTSAGNLYVTPGNGATVSIDVPIANNTGTGVLTLVKNGSSVLRLYKANTYTGDTIINSGTLQIGVNGLTTGANLGSGTYAGNIFIGAGASLDFQTNSNQTLSGVISGDGALLKRYIGTLTLSGANTYTGKTTLGAITNAGDPTLVVSSFNSVVGGTASSSLGAPTTVANGTIELGSNNSTPNPTLRYTGAAATGEITDRVINFVFNGTATRTLDASGPSGLLKFTSAFTSNGTTTGHITLTGTGLGEITQGLPFAFTDLNKTGTGTWTLSGSNIYTGTTTISAGTLALTGTNTTTALTMMTGGALTGSPALNGLATINNFSTDVWSLSSNIKRTGNLTFNGGTGIATSLTLSGAINLGASTNLFVVSNVGNASGTNAITISGSTSNTMGLTFQGKNPAALPLNTVTLAKTGGAIAVSGDITIGQGGLNHQKGILQLGGNEQIADTAQVTLGTSGYVGNTQFRLLGFSETIAGLNSSASTFVGGGTGNAIVENGSAVVGTSTLTVSGSSTYTYGPKTGSNLNLRDGSTGKLAFTKDGVGTQIFSSVNSLTYSGATTVNDGILRIISSTLTNSDTTLNGGTLDLQTATLNKAISGSGGQVTVSAGTTTNFGGGNKTYSGDTVISGGTTILLQTAANSLSANSIHSIGTGAILRTGNLAGSVKALTGVGSVDLNGASAILTIADGASQDFGGAIGGLGALTKSGAGTQTLSGAANTYGGKTSVKAGTVSFTTGNFSAVGNQSLGTNSAVDLGVALTSSGTLLYTGGAGTLAKDVNALGNGNNTIENNGGGTLTLSGTLAKNGTTLVLKNTNGGSQMIVSNAITGASANSDMFFDGGTTTLNAVSTYNGPTTVQNSGTVKLGIADALPITTDLSLLTSGIFDLAGFNQAIASLAGNSATAKVTNSGTGADRTLEITGAATKIYDGFIEDGTSTTALKLTGTGFLTMNGNSTYSGGTIVRAGTLTGTGTNSSLGTTTGTLEVSNVNTGAATAVVVNLSTTAPTTTGSLSGTIATASPVSPVNTATINNGGQTYSVNQTADSTFAGNIAGAGGFTLGSGSTNTLTLSGNNGYTGATTVDAGTLEVTGTLSGTTGVNVNSGGTMLLNNNVDDIINTAANVAVAGGTVRVANGVDNRNQNLGSLTLTATSTLDFGTGANGNTLTFASLAFTATKLNIWNWSGTAYGAGVADTGSFGSDTQDRLLFNADTIYTGAADSRIEFFSDSGSTSLGFGQEVAFGGQFELVPITAVPEPATTALIGAVALCALIGYRERRRFTGFRSRLASK